MGTQTIDTAAINARIDLRQLAGNVTQLHREAVNELSGPCPRCGGEDRFHVTADWWFCRACHEKRSDAIGFMQWLHNVEFLEAVKMLDSNTVRFAEVERQAAQRAPEPEFMAKAPALMRRMLDNMRDMNPGKEYLYSRGFTDTTLDTFRVGYTPDAMGQGPAIALPWYRGGALHAIHYRYLAKDANPKMKFHKGGYPGGLLFGGHTLATTTPALLAHRTLFVVEGELNAMSVWQVASAGRVDVLSLGGQGSRMTPAAVTFAAQYRARVVWMDEQEKAIGNARLLNAGAMWSGKPKRDANDHLQDMTLRDMVAAAMLKCSPPSEALRFDLRDMGYGLD